MTKKNLHLAFLFLLMALAWPLLANAVSYSPIPAKREEKTANGTKEVGDMVCLFQSGTADVKKEINIHDILVVYRETSTHRLRQVGKIRIVSYKGEDYLKAEVVEGELRPGDIAKKGDAASLVISSDDKCK